MESWSRVLILALSYMWATRDSPDPDGAQLKSVAASRWIKKTPEYRDKTIVVFWDWGSTGHAPWFTHRRANRGPREEPLERRCGTPTRIA